MGSHKKARGLLNVVAYHVRCYLIIVLLLVMTIPAQAQGDGQRYFERSRSASSVSYTRADSLQGGVTAERAWWDLTHYHLQVAVNIENRALSGLNRMTYRVRENLDEQTSRLMQRSGVAKAAVEAAKIPVGCN